MINAFLTLQKCNKIRNKPENCTKDENKTLLGFNIMEKGNMYTICTYVYNNHHFNC